MIQAEDAHDLVPLAVCVGRPSHLFCETLGKVVDTLLYIQDRIGGSREWASEGVFGELEWAAAMSLVKLELMNRN